MILLFLVSLSSKAGDQVPALIGSDRLYKLTKPAIRIVDGNRYNTKTADIVAHGSFLGGYRGDQLGRSQILYKTKEGDFFIFYETTWEDELDRLEVVSDNEAQVLYCSLPSSCPEPSRRIISLPPQLQKPQVSNPTAR